MKKGNLLLYPNWKEVFKSLPAEVAQQMLINLFEVIETGEIPELPLSYLDTYATEGPQQIIMQQAIQELRKSYEGQYMSMAQVVLQDAGAYEAKCEQNRQNRLKAEAAKRKAQLDRVSKFISDYSIIHDQEPSIEEIATQLNIKESEVYYLLSLMDKEQSPEPKAPKDQEDSGLSSLEFEDNINTVFQPKKDLPPVPDDDLDNFDDDDDVPYPEAED